MTWASSEPASPPELARRNVVDIRDLVPQPWRNGFGSTRQIATGSMSSRAGRTPGAWDWRVSLADLTSTAPFSTFEGIDRVAVLAGRTPVMLKGLSRSLRFDRQGAMHAFPGEEPLDAELSSGAATRLLNVMTRRHEARAVIDVVTTCWTQLAADASGFLVVLRGAFSLEWPDEASQASQEFQLEAGQLVHERDRVACVRMEPASPDACLVSIRIHPWKNAVL